MIIILLTIITAGLIVSSEVLEYFNDKRKWNGGICPETQEEWLFEEISFDGKKLVFKSQEFYIHLKYHSKRW